MRRTIESGSGNRRGSGARIRLRLKKDKVKEKAPEHTGQSTWRLRLLKGYLGLSYGRQ